LSEAMTRLLMRRIAGSIVVTAENRHIVKEGDRYKVYLPGHWNELWEELRRVGKTVAVVIIVK
jgi:hypothetical protein